MVKTRRRSKKSSKKSTVSLKEFKNEEPIVKMIDYGEARVAIQIIHGPLASRVTVVCGKPKFKGITTCLREDVPIKAKYLLRRMINKI